MTETMLDGAGSVEAIPGRSGSITQATMELAGRTAPWIPILGYHRVVQGDVFDPHMICTSSERFRFHLEWFARLGYRTLSLPEIAPHLASGRHLPGRTFIITFDDGYEDNFTLALPLLQRYGFTATVFVVAGQVGRSSAWDDTPAPMMTWDQIRAMKAAGITIGSHSVSHPHLSQLSIEQARREIEDSKDMLEQNLGSEVTTFCYPYGDWLPTMCQAVRSAGYALATDDVGRREHRRYALARVDPRFWPPPFTPLVRSHRWYFLLGRTGILNTPRTAKWVMRRSLAQVRQAAVSASRFALRRTP
jgi:peptidoglycan/xylan/chitin deacetylase (PgdA/CDA1 family)